MEKSRMSIVVVLPLLLVVLLVGSVPVSVTERTAASSPPSSPAGPAHLLSSGVVRASSPAPLTGFPRTVLIETFTGVWCIHCPAESIALHNIDENTSHSVLSIAELHVCAFPPGSGPCLENYVPPDGTSDSRGIFYNVCGYPDVFFDGQHDMCGATNSDSQMQGIYDRAIANASMYPGNVSITQTAQVSSGNVTAHATIASAIDGSYNVITYLLEYIGKQNINIGYGPHDVDWVVRETMMNHPVTLTSGGSVDVSSLGVINSTWNRLNLSVVTLVQQNSTKIVENANMAPVTTLTTAVTSTQATLVSGTTSTITVRVDNSSTGTPVAGATVNLSTQGGALSPENGVTAADGTFTSTFTAPNVSTAQDFVISAGVNATNYTAGSGNVAILVTPVVLPLAPSGLTVGPGDLNVSLNWSAPSSGGTGLTYHIFRSTAQAGPYAEVGTSVVPGYVDSDVIGGQSYWYEVSAANTFGFSPNTSAAPATAIIAATGGIPGNIGWWISIDSINVSSATNDSLYLFVPDGLFSYSFGPESYAYVSSGGGSGTLHALGTVLDVTAAFTPRYAILEGTVNPSDASVVVSGTPVAVAGGSFTDLLVAGTYTVTVSAPGYETNDTPVVLTPGNLTPLAIQLNPNPSSGSTTSSFGGLSGSDALLIVVGVVAVAAIVGAGVVVSSRRKRAQPPPESPPYEEP